MTKPKLTVTLGRSSGHVVRMRDRIDSENDANGGKRSVRDRLGKNGESSSQSGRKRQRGGVDNELRPAKQIGKNDLRLKLLRKKKSLQNQHDAEALRKVDFRGQLYRPSSLSRTVMIMPQHQSLTTASTIPRHLPPQKNSEISRFSESSSSRRPYSSQELDELIKRSPERISRPTQDILPRRISSILQDDLSIRSAGALRSLQLRNADLLNYRPTGPAPLPQRTVTDSLPTRTFPESSQPIRQLPLSTTLVRPSPLLSEEPATVSGLLQSLGLSKYYINFQAEEVDMPTLRQMGDIDLKEMGIPMGPRKKILLSINPRVTKWPA